MICAASVFDSGWVSRSVREIMGCFFDCFRVKNEARPQSHFISEAVSSKRREPVVSRNRLAALLLSEDNEDSPGMGSTIHSLESPYKKENDSVLKDEAKFLKSCGTLSETPIEIRKTSGRVKDMSLDARESEDSIFHSWLRGTSIEKLHREEKQDRTPSSSFKLGDELGMTSDSSEHRPRSSMGQMLVRRESVRSDENNVVRSPDAATNVLVYSSDDDLPAVVSQFKNKSVRFECESDTALPPKCEQSLEQFDTPGQNAAKPSPYPTPLKLTDEMQTPGTVYPLNTESLANRKYARIRSQYVYPVMNPVQNFSQLMALKEEDSYDNKQLDLLGDPIEQDECATPGHTTTSHSNKLAMDYEATAIDGREVTVDASLSNWLKPSSSSTADITQNFGSVPSGRSCSDRTPEIDRPIIGLVAAHWNENEPSNISPKWWDGNGIPNSTNKYKEDQKVSWHATPFEERLEKALSNESHVAQRRLSDGPLDLVENEEESDTALSRLHPPKHLSESLLSF
ncbi:hypothetical protein Scep_027668 [Stephania cephalantha]|uniref:Protein JASON n=1 Tax=Stephania cephalantha TaxID=152367 RepID=A0AAP0E8J3_9MAGN